MDSVFDAELVTRRRLRAAAKPVPGADFLMRRVCEDLELRLSAVDRSFADAACLHAGSPLPAAAMAATGKARSILRLEEAPELLGDAEGMVSPREFVPLAPGSIDLAVSVLALQEVNDVPGTLAQIRRALRPDGLFLGAFAGDGTLAELRECLVAAEAELTGGASPRVAPFADVREAGALLQRAGFALPVTDVERMTVRYDTMFDLMFDLRAMGVTNSLAARSRVPARRALFVRAAQIYAERFSDDDGRVRASFSIIWMSGWAPHESQQKPLKPGSATASLAQYLERKG